MTGWLNQVSVERGVDRLDTYANLTSGRKPVLPKVGLRMCGGWLSTFGMALGYLGLVAMLSMAPYWHMAGAPHQSHIMACTDFGGSR